MTADPIEARKCTCGTDMELVGKGYFLCPNDDRPQEKEYVVLSWTTNHLGETVPKDYYKRVETLEDRRYALKWKERMGEIYGEGGSGI